MTHKRPSNIFSRIKVRHQLYIIFFVAIFIPVLGLGNYLIYNSRSTLTDHYKEQAHSDNLRVKSLLLDLTYNLYNNSQILSQDAALRKLLSTDFSTENEAELAEDAFPGIKTLLEQDVSIQDISVYTYNETLPDSEYIHPVNRAVMQESWYAEASTSVTPFWTVEKSTDRFDNHFQILTLHTRIFLPKTNTFAILNMGVSTNHIKNRIENSSLKSSLWLNDGQNFYQSPSSSLASLPENYVKDGGSYYLGKLKVDNNNSVIGCVSTLSTSYSDDVFYIASLDYDACPYLRKITLIHIAIILLILVPTTIFVLFYSRYFSHRVVTLRQTMHEVSLGNYEITDTFHGTDEISEAFKDLNVMVQEILRMEKEAYESTIHTKELVNQQQQMEFKMLSSQINPHFLYNTLETIRMRALKAGNREVANAVKLLGKSMRYVLSNTTTAVTSLDKELDYIETYLSIQKLRFHDRVNYTLKTDPDLNLSDYQIMPLLLQPIVENAVLHGLEEVEENGRIIIHIHRGKLAVTDSTSASDTSTLIIEIFDNGCGMTSGELSHMIENMYHHPKESSKSIGLHNIYQRIQLCYGSEYGLRIKSKKNRGTLFIMTIPAKLI